MLLTIPVDYIIDKMKHKDYQYCKSLSFNLRVIIIVRIVFGITIFNVYNTQIIIGEIMEALTGLSLVIIIAIILFIILFSLLRPARIVYHSIFFRSQSKNI